MEHSDNQPSGTTNASYGLDRAPGSGVGALFAVGAAGTILRYDGTNWASQASGTTQTLYSVGKVPMIATDFVVGAAGTILQTTATSWTSQGSTTTRDLFVVGDELVLSSTNVYAAGGAGTILHYDGTTWSAQASGTTSAIHGATASTSTDIFMVGDGGVIVHSSNGSTWTAQVSGTTNDLAAASTAAPNDVFVVGAGARDRRPRHLKGETGSPMSVTTPFCALRLVPHAPDLPPRFRSQRLTLVPRRT
jgi:hypothetical protein